MPGQLRVKARAQKRREPGTMTATEKRYAAELEARRLTGLIDRWDYEPESLVLAKGSRYTPDFRVVDRDGFVSMVEVKPHNWDKIPNQSNSATKIKVAADLHPYVFVRAVEQKKRDGFVETIVEGR